MRKRLTDTREERSAVPIKSSCETKGNIRNPGIWTSWNVQSTLTNRKTHAPVDVSITLRKPHLVLCGTPSRSGRSLQGQAVYLLPSRKKQAASHDLYLNVTARLATTGSKFAASGNDVGADLSAAVLQKLECALRLFNIGQKAHERGVCLSRLIIGARGNVDNANHRCLVVPQGSSGGRSEGLDLRFGVVANCEISGGRRNQGNMQENFVWPLFDTSNNQC
ncbi:uncharacterized protein BDR25DRAFT_348006 [Lindgomyces ingoldianus]|uniref:Uncharacterized protein n=1 Tax=Lindgomyces ingoldianus TaxID=673940 RepID=A0ACB6RH78_9PLEO|nr:uncharacterized protein BDR25DRAFT_348006 [Lindgomyces ingoldianus]KAF2477682.1 hypothetical protein BDR25DRAFT_348006 [Lindgomyces ingoldianus]